MWAFPFWKHDLYKLQPEERKKEWDILQNCHISLCVMEFLYAWNFVKYLLQNKGTPLLPIPNKKEQSYLDITLSYKDRKTGINPGEAVNKLYLCSLAIYKQLFVYALWPGAQEGFLYSLDMWRQFKDWDLTIT